MRVLKINDELQFLSLLSLSEKDIDVHKLFLRLVRFSDEDVV